MIEHILKTEYELIKESQLYSAELNKTERILIIVETKMKVWVPTFKYKFEIVLEDEKNQTFLYSKMKIFRYNSKVGYCDIPVQLQLDDDKSLKENLDYMLATSHKSKMLQDIPVQKEEPKGFFKKFIKNKPENGNEEINQHELEEKNINEVKTTEKTPSFPPPFQNEVITEIIDKPTTEPALSKDNTGWESTEPQEKPITPITSVIETITESKIKDLMAKETLPLIGTLKNIIDTQKQLVEQIGLMKQEIYQLKSMKNQFFDSWYPWLFTKSNGFFLIPEKYNPVLIIFTDFDDSERDKLNPLVEKIKEKNLFFAAIPDSFEDRFLCNPSILFSKNSPIPEFDNAFFFESIFTQFILRKSLEYRDLFIIAFKRSGIENLNKIVKYTAYFDPIIEKITDLMNSKDKKIITEKDEMDSSLYTTIKKISRIFENMQSNPDKKVRLQYLEIHLKSSKRFAPLEATEIDYLSQTLDQLFSINELKLL